MGSERSERRLAAIMAADVVGYSRLIEADEAATLAALKSLRSEAIDPIIADHKGRIVKLTGDGIITEFASVVDAVASAVAIQKAVAGRQADVLPARRLVFRIGINVGDVVVEGDDLLGDGVNVAARLEQLCEPGGVLVSGTAFDHMQGRLGLPLDFTGEQQVKNISRPVRTYRVRMEGMKRRRFALDRRRIGRLLPAASVFIAALLLAAGVAWWLLPGTEANAKPSIAVLPFDNLGNDEATERLASGITEDIITDLSRFRDLGVIARNSVEAYRDQDVDIRQVGRDLNVRYVLEGSIQRQEDQVRVTAQLIEAETGTHVWSERWDRPLEDIFAVQTELSEQLAGQLGGYTGTVTAADRAAAMRKRPSDLTAYDLYLLGLEGKTRETRESVEQAIEYLKQAIEIDPTFARAWTVLGSCYAISERWSEDFEETHRLNLEAMRRGVELDPQDAEAHANLAFSLAVSGDLEQSEAEFETAERLNPNSADVLTRYASWAGRFGHPEDGAAMAERAFRLNPNPPPWAIRFLRNAFTSAEKYDAALQVHQRMPATMFIDWDVIDGAVILEALGRHYEAQAAAAEALAAFPIISIEYWTGDAAWRDEDRQRFVELMRDAGFPPCTTDELLAEGWIVVRLPECVQS